MKAARVYVTRSVRLPGHEPGGYELPSPSDAAPVWSAGWFDQEFLYAGLGRERYRRGLGEGWIIGQRVYERRLLEAQYALAGVEAPGAPIQFTRIRKLTTPGA